MPCTLGSAAKAATTSSTRDCPASAGNTSLRLSIPALAACTCLLRTYRWLGPSSPTSTVARHTGGEPAAVMVAANSATISSRRRLPSIRIAPPGVRIPPLEALDVGSFVTVVMLRRPPSA